MTDLLIKNCRPMGGPAVDVLIRDGAFATMAPQVAPGGAAVEDGNGAILLPGLVDAHAHLDKSFLGYCWHAHSGGPTTLDKIDNERRMKHELKLDPALQSARQVVQAVAMGTSHINSHVDVDTECGVASIEGVMATRERYRDAVGIKIIAFPQSGLLRRPGTMELMHAAMKLGADAVGGIDPCGLDRDPKGHLDAIFSLAQAYGRPIDLHLHETGSMGAFSLDMIFERTRALGMQGMVTISHAFCLGDGDRDLVDPLIDRLAELDIAIMTTGPAARPAPPVKRLVERGVRVCAGVDGIRDAWSPYGNPDLLERAMLIGLRNNFRTDPDLGIALGLCSSGGAAVMRLERYGLEVGCIAAGVLVEAETVAEAIVSRPVRKLVFKGGKVVARDGKVLIETPAA